MWYILGLKVMAGYCDNCHMNTTLSVVLIDNEKKMLCRHCISDLQNTGTMRKRN